MKQLTLTSNGVTANLTLRSATIADNMRRSMLAARAFETPLEDPAEQTVAVVIYPRCLACTVTGEIVRAQGLRPEEPQPAKELTSAQFVSLPAEIGEAWLSAALELNPGWSMTPLTADEQTSAEKKD
jgi:hypothetical protein